MNPVAEMPKAKFSIGESLLQAGRPEEALDHLRRQVIENHTSPGVWTNLGICHRLLNQYQESVDAFERALALAPESPLAIFNFGNLLTDVGMFDGALNMYEKAFHLDPQRQMIALAYAYALLREGRWEAAWPLYEFGRYRYSWKEPPGLALWNGESLEGKIILVLMEGGYGDVFQWLPWVGKLKEMGAIVSLFVEDRLIPLLEGHEFIDHLIPASAELDPTGYDCCTSILSIPALLNIPYSDDLYMGRMLGRPYLRYLDGGEENPNFGELKVGICWKAEESGSVKKYRSLAASDLDSLAAIDSSKVRFISLIPRKWAADKPEWMEHCPVDGWVDTVELIQNLDLIVTVDTAVAHLAGALKKPVWILLPPGSEWRWFRTGEASPWYPTATLLRSTYDDGGLKSLVPTVKSRIEGML